MSLAVRLRAIHLAALASVLVHAGVLVEVGHRYVAMGQREEPSVVTFQAVIASAPSLVKPQPAVQPRPRTRPRKPHPVPKPKSVTKPKPAEPRPVTEPPVPPEPASPAGKPETETAPGMVSIVTMQRDYTQKILQRIEQHKHYPPAARRRRITGTVTLHLQLDAGGRIQTLRCTRGTALLCRAAERAARAAEPFPPLPEGTQQLSFDYRMRFRLH